MEVPCKCDDCEEFKTKVRQQIWAFHLFGSIDPSILLQNLTDLVGIEGEHKMPFDIPSPPPCTRVLLDDEGPTANVTMTTEADNLKVNSARGRPPACVQTKNGHRVNRLKRSGNKIRPKNGSKMSTKLSVQKLKGGAKNKLNMKKERKSSTLNGAGEGSVAMETHCDNSDSNPSTDQVELEGVNHQKSKGSKSKKRFKIRILARKVRQHQSTADKKGENNLKGHKVPPTDEDQEVDDQEGNVAVMKTRRNLRRKRPAHRRNGVNLETGKPKRFVGDKKAWLKIHDKIRKVSLVDGTTQFDCTICNNSFNLHYLVARHIRIVHFHQRKSCEQCGRGFYDGRNLRNHLLVCTGKPPPRDLTAGKEKVERQRRHRPRTQITSTTAFRERFKRGSKII